MISEFTKKMVQKAENDYAAAKRELTFEEPLTDIICFHCQQAVEKYLKAFLITMSVDFERTHNVDYLIGSCASIDTDFSSIDLQDINFFAVEVRYPDNFYKPDEEEARMYFEIAGKVRELVLSKLEMTPGELSQ